ncbi:MAG: hypothetical protein ACFFCQ_04460 [Promethearchaeota archaeon]
MFYKCTNDVCAEKYKSNEPMDRCPRCYSLLAEGIDLVDVMSKNYIILDSK